MTSLLEQAQELLNKQHLTMDDVKELDRIESQATGEEAIMIGELWESVYAMADDKLLAQLQNAHD